MKRIRIVAACGPDLRPIVAAGLRLMWIPEQREAAFAYRTAIVTASLVRPFAVITTGMLSPTGVSDARMALTW